MEDTKKKLKSFFQGEKKIKILVLLGAVGMLLIMLSEYIPSIKKDDVSNENSVSVTADEYCTALEKRLTAIVSSISGAGKCEVLITLESGTEKIYLKDEKTSYEKTQEIEGDSSRTEEKSENENGVIVIDGQNGEEGMLSKEIEPVIRGVVVVCEGGGDVSVNQRIVNAVTTALNISSARVFVTELEPSGN